MRERDRAVVLIMKTETVHSPHDAITGKSGCLAMDLILPEHLPKKHPNNFPVVKHSINSRKRKITELQKQHQGIYTIVPGGQHRTSLSLPITPIMPSKSAKGLP